MAWPIKSCVPGSRPNFWYTALMGVLFGSTPATHSTQNIVMYRQTERERGKRAQTVRALARVRGRAGCNCRTLVGLGVGRVVLAHKLEEQARAVLLKETHQRRLHGLHLGRRKLRREGSRRATLPSRACTPTHPPAPPTDLGDLAVAVHVAAGNLLELEVARHFGVHQDVDQVLRRHPSPRPARQSPSSLCG
jgi:hypothetical protein